MVRGAFEWAVAERPLAGEEASGDLALVTARTDGTLVAVVDGLGHGGGAAAAARLAVDTLREHADDDLGALVRRCHRALRHTRGAVLALGVARDDGTLTWTGVGNIQAVVARTDRSGARSHEHALMLGGVLGMRVPRVQPRTTTLAPGDVVALATDGIAQAFVDALGAGPPQRTAEDILQRHANARDDALVLVGQYRTAQP